MALVKEQNHWRCSWWN